MLCIRRKTALEQEEKRPQACVVGCQLQGRITAISQHRPKGGQNKVRENIPEEGQKNVKKSVKQKYRQLQKAGRMSQEGPGNRRRSKEGQN